MGVIFHKGKKYGGTGVKVQSDPAATSLNALEVPNGQTMTSYLNSNFVGKGTLLGTLTTATTNTLSDSIKNYKYLLVEINFVSGNNTFKLNSVMFATADFNYNDTTYIMCTFYDGTVRKGYFNIHSATQVYTASDSFTNITNIKVYGLK